MAISGVKYVYFYSRCVPIILYLLLSILIFSSTKTSGLKCETLKTSLVYQQDKAPRDLSTLLPLIVEKVNRELQGVVDVEVLYEGGRMNSRTIGEHHVKCSVTRLVTALDDAETLHHTSSDGTIPSSDLESSSTSGMDRDNINTSTVTQCFTVPFTIKDVDECHLPAGHFMKHKCEYPSLCINTPGSYECVCPSSLINIETYKDDSFSLFQTLEKEAKSPWDISFNSSSSSSCPGKASTHSCCDTYAHSTEGSSCRAQFRCPLDPCIHSNDCHTSAQCIPAENPLDRPSFHCECPKDLMGNGRKCRKGIDPKPKPMLKYDGITPTDTTLKNNLYCGCTKPVLDVCEGFPKCQGKNEICTVYSDNKPKCACKPGFVKDDTFGCVDETPPILKLNNDPLKDSTLHLKQGDIYKEYAVQIIDDNAEDYLRSLKITYSRPLPPGCLTQMGSFHVNYTVATPWTSPPYVRVTRNVIISDIDECSIDVSTYERQCPQLIPKCDTQAGAKCINTQGSYTCKCPKYTSGDGFLPIGYTHTDMKGSNSLVSHGYVGGSGCRDTTKPSIYLLGPNPKIFRTCKCGGLGGVMKPSKKRRGELGISDNLDFIERQKKGYEEDIRNMIKDTAGAELCASHTLTSPKPSNCVRATDKTFQGDVDLTMNVNVGDPEHISQFEWRVPYNVFDEAGNAAETIWRNILVEQVDINGLEKKIREEVLASKERDIDQAVKEALLEERKKSAKIISSTNKQAQKPSSTCAPCNCPKQQKSITSAECSSMCTNNGMNRNSDSIIPDSNYSDIAAIVHSLQDTIALFNGLASPSFAVVILVCTILAVIYFFIQIIFRSLARNGEDWNYLPVDEEKEKEMLKSVTYFRSPQSVPIQQNLSSATKSTVPRSSMLIGNLSQKNSINATNRAGITNRVLFSPHDDQSLGQREEDFLSPQSSNYSTFRQSMSPITPLR
mmetsp:Transcript_1633/g.2319  ORF Transcript_1633/g.2319 Transcript_1633/m.2319 type:complete len:950 (+) Transcript_1633:57-2906(+)|eukprot:CAMPEP_0184872040 /NCGR_PEP_ID=MMETSP0580-20130426/41060_1 /TAXON_ID=1118495 /ORGANISM="Dactyliosolen fragilissimus" /LENGTH=949 /DNA_ID=CAMNT_0027374777 /DNA_START=424 /DNA_END=3273 /DNA_ORIENTATION=-